MLGRKVQNQLCGSRSRKGQVTTALMLVQMSPVLGIRGMSPGSPIFGSHGRISGDGRRMTGPGKMLSPKVGEKERSAAKTPERP